MRVIFLKGGVTIGVNKYGLVYLYQDRDIIGPLDKDMFNDLIGEMIETLQNKTER